MNPIKTTIWGGIAFLSVAVVFTVACKKQSSTGSIPAGRQSVALYLNDDPVSNLKNVFVDIRYVEVKVDTGAVQHEDSYYDDDHEGDSSDIVGVRHDCDRFGEWDTLHITPGVYDLLRLKNGVDTLLAKGLAYTGKVTRLRITLGSGSTIVTDSAQTYPLGICDGKPYVYVRVISNDLDNLGGGQYRVRVDFDLARSIEYENGHYCLQPKLSSYSDNMTGRIKGTVGPAQAHAWVMAVNGSDTAYAMPEADGTFQIRGLEPTGYTVHFRATAPYMDSVVYNVAVRAGTVTQMPAVVLHQ